ncbi:MAG: hypothetical protein JKY34_02530 [Kordiimonadaceae bacterium]|nr:hypothetical protein [Kordiimonadaceae bacterium]
MRIEWPEVVQGMVVSLSTAIALVPILMAAFGLTFEEAVAISFLHSVLITSSIWLFGETYAPGWVTPALPIVLVFVIQGYATPDERFQMMTALSLDFAALLFLLGITGLGKTFFNHVPTAFKAGIILGAAIAAFKRVFVDDFDKLAEVPWSAGLAIVTCLIFSFSAPFARMKDKIAPLKVISSLGLLPGFIIAGIAGVITNELVFDIQWGILIPPFADMFAKVSPFAIGWPSLSFFIDAIPMALITYILLFGDLLTGEAIVKEAQDKRPDDVIDVNINRSHLSIAIRNGLMAIFAPFFPTQGCLWTGVQVIVVEKWKEGSDRMESLIGGISAYYLYGIPVFILFLPLLTLLKPFMFIALLLTLILTGFACSYVAIAMVKDRTERGVMLMTAVTLAFFDPTLGLAVGLLGSLLLIGPEAFKQQS